VNEESLFVESFSLEIAGMFALRLHYSADDEPPKGATPRSEPARPACTAPSPPPPTGWPGRGKRRSTGDS